VRINPVPAPGMHAAAIHLAQMTARAAAHQSSPTARPVEAPAAIVDDTAARRPSRHTFDIRV